MGKHTPGPWRVNGECIEYGPFVAGDGWCVAKIVRDPPETEANAHLIAAAPELLEACKYAQHRLQTAIRRGRKTDQPCLEMVEAAIRRAEE
jgi:hypothetical protein